MKSERLTKIQRDAANSHSALELFTSIPRQRLINLNTPIERLDRLRQSIPGAPQLWIKRDDLTGYLGGGNKLRKLEYVMAHALSLGTTTILTTGSVTSNLARTTALVARRFGLKVELILSGGDPEAARANWRIAELLDVKVHRVTASDQRATRMQEVARDLEERGERVYQIPLGASNEIGSFGMVAAFEEVGIQQLELGLQFDAIVFATSSGGTQAGLEVGKRLFNYRDLHLLGISADDPFDVIKENVFKAVGPMLSTLGKSEAPAWGDLHVDDGFVGGGYAVSTRESREAEKLFAETEGILLDPVYTSKAAAGLIAYSREGRFKETDRVLFWHTGGALTLL
ncbi:MAG TPA: D-cysteine desulfhydrase family protein [Pyrinomonadaceae bacterium]|nr:D-cysteine desulfhydrase family protein [Pyrinomonadaceae bacterium]